MIICCPSLQRETSLANGPLLIDDELNEIHLLHGANGRDGYSILRFCPFCGTEIVRSNRSSYFHSLEQSEIDAIRLKMKGIMNMQDVEHTLGKPDNITIITSSHHGPIEAFVYEHLSPTVVLYVRFPPNKKPILTFSAKPIG